MEKIDWVRFNKGSRQLSVQGIANTSERKELVREAIILIQKDPNTALEREYLGYKQYDRFGDQRCDCEYGMGPRHGSIVFRIGRNRNYEPGIDSPEDAVYFLKCFRDAPGREQKERDYNRTENIQETFNRMRNLELESGKLQEWLDPIEVDAKDEELVKA